MKLFTVVLDFDGGTYVSQTRARTIAELSVRIAADIDWDAVLGRSRRDARRRYCAALSESEPVPVAGLVSVWCLSALFGRKVAVVHVVQTADLKTAGLKTA